MKQLSLGETGFLPKAGKQARKVVFLEEMDKVVLWSHLEGLIEPFYRKKGLAPAGDIWEEGQEERSENGNVTPH